MKKILTAICLALALALAASAQAQVYMDNNGSAITPNGSFGWATGTYNWDASTTSNWTTSGSGNITTATYNAIIGSNVATFDTTGAGTGKKDVLVGANFNLANGLTFAGTRPQTFTSTSVKTLTMGGGTLTQSSSGLIRLGANLTITGNFTKEGAGVLFLDTVGTGAAFSGTLTHNEGLLQVNSSRFTAASKIVMGGGTLRLDTIGTTTIGNLSGNGTIDSRSAGSPYNLTITQSTAGTYSGKLSFNPNTATANTLGYTKAGSAALTLSGSNDYDGTMTVSAGKLIIANNNALSNTAASVANTAGAALQINNGITIGNNLTLSGSNSQLIVGTTGAVGTATSGGNLTATSGGKFIFDLNGTTAADKLVVTGTVNLGGTITLTLNDLGGSSIAANTIYTLMAGGAGAWSGTPTFATTLPTGWVLDSTYGTGGILYDPALKKLNVRFSAVPTAVVIFQADASTVVSVADSGWSASATGPASSGLQILPVAEGKILSVDVGGQKDLYINRNIAFTAGKVVRIEITARASGQIEQVTGKWNDTKFGPEIQWELGPEWKTFSVQAKSNGGNYRFNIRSIGVGTFEILSTKITELPDWSFPAVQAPFRGELLGNWNFAMGSLGWKFYRPATASGIASTEPDAFSMIVREPPSTGPYMLKLPAVSMTSFLDAGEKLILYTGRNYKITLKGSGTFEAQLIRPGMAPASSPVVKTPLKVVSGGVVTANVMISLPLEGMATSLENDFSLRIKHDGSTAGRIESISCREDDTVPTPDSPRAGIEIAVRGERGNRLATLGDNIKFRVVTAGLLANDLITLMVKDENNATIKTVPSLRVGTLSDGRLGVETVVNTLPPGWFQATAIAPGKTINSLSDDLAVVLREDPAMVRSGFLGTHFRFENQPYHVDLHKKLGFRHVRTFDLSWYLLQPTAGGVVEIPEDLLNAFANGGLEPLVQLYTTPQWASSKPAGNTGDYKLYPPKNMADWENYVRMVVRGAGSRVRFYEIWNEPNLHSLKVDPARGKTTEQVYGDLVRTAYPIIKAENPNAVVVIGACAGHPSFTMNAIKNQNLYAFFDVISYHAYGGAPQSGIGAEAFAYTQNYMKNQLAIIGKPATPIYDSESGIKYVADGAEGLAVAKTFAKGLVGRQAAGFSRYYMYNSYPRQYSQNYNFNMLMGFNDRPLLTMPMIATWDRLLGDASYVENLADDATGDHIYRFRRKDGFEVIAAWTNFSDGQYNQSIIPSPAALDALGRSIPAAVQGSTLNVNGDLRYFFPTALLPKLGL